ncbi:MAG: TonB-dependent receptor plug domain-containing protein, partial [Tannerellaceae bacterium]
MKGKTSLALGFIFSVALQTLNAQNSLPDSLQNLRNIKLDEVVVTAITASKETPVAYTNVSKEEVGKRNFGKDIPHLLSQTPSVIVTSDAGTGIGYTGFRVRGTDANRINITVNGVPVNDSESHT